MKELAEINYIEECNGLAEALFLLEQRLELGCFDLQTVLQTLFLYWFMLSEPAYFTNDNRSRNWVRLFKSLLLRAEPQYIDNADFCWAVGYLLKNFPGRAELHKQGECLLNKALEISPENLIARTAQAGTTVAAESLPPEVFAWFNEWGSMGEFFKYRLLK